MTTTTVLTFHNNPTLKELLLARIGKHEKADAIARGSYEQWNGTVKRCAIGCSLRDLSDRDNVPTDWHQEMEDRLGIPYWLAELEDRVFEGLPAEVANGWPRRFSEAVPIGVSLDGLADRLAIRRLREECLPLSDAWPEPIRTQVVAAIGLCIAALEGKSSRSVAQSAAWSAARSAGSAARSQAYGCEAEWSAESAARSAARAAESAEWSAESAESAAESAESAARLAARLAAQSAARLAAQSAAWLAESAARSQAYGCEADRIVEELSGMSAV